MGNEGFGGVNLPPIRRQGPRCRDRNGPGWHSSKDYGDQNGVRLRYGRFLIIFGGKGRDREERVGKGEKDNGRE